MKINYNNFFSVLALIFCAIFAQNTNAQTCNYPLSTVTGGGSGTNTFTKGYTISFQTLANNRDVAVTFTLDAADKYVNTIASQIWVQSPTFHAINMVRSGLTYTGTISGFAEIINGTNITLQAMLGTVDGNITTQLFSFRVGDCSVNSADTAAPTPFTATLVSTDGFSATFSVKATDGSGPITYTASNGTNTETISGASNTAQTLTVYGLTPLTGYSFNIVAKDALNNVTAAIVVPATTGANTNTPCAGHEDLGSAVFPSGLDYSFSTSGTTVTVVYKLRENPVGLVVNLFYLDNNGTWRSAGGMTNSSLTFTKTLSTQTVGQVLQFAADILWNPSPNEKISTYRSYTVGNNCVADSTPPTAFTATVGAITSNSVELLVNGTDNLGTVIFTATATPGGKTATVSGTGQKSLIFDGLTPNTTYTFSVTAKDFAGNAAANSAISLAATTAADTSTPCAGQSIAKTTSPGSYADYTNGYQYAVTSNGSAITVTFTLLDNLTISNAWLVSNSPEQVMTINGKVAIVTFTPTVSPIIWAVKTNSGGTYKMTKDFTYTVGDNCSVGPPANVCAATNKTAVAVSQAPLTLGYNYNFSSSNGSVTAVFKLNDNATDIVSPRLHWKNAGGPDQYIDMVPVEGLSQTYIATIPAASISTTVISIGCNFVWGSGGYANTVLYSYTVGDNCGVDICKSFLAVSPITNVTFNTLNKISSASTSSPGYEDFTADAPATVVRGQSYTLTVKGNTSGNFNCYYNAFFDWNKDGDFDDAGEGPIKIGTIRNSNGSDGKVASVYLPIPAVVGNVKMRIIGRLSDYNPTSCVSAGSVGQVEDYMISIQDVCSGTPDPGKTISTASSVCPNVPFTLSLEKTLTDGATYTWQTSPDGNSWTGAIPTSTTFFSSDFSAAQTGNSTVGEISLYGDASIIGGELFLTQLGIGYYGGFLIKSPPGTNIAQFTTTFYYKIDEGNGADGMSLSYGSNVNPGQGAGENGEGDGLILEFDTYDNEGAGGGSRVRVKYANNYIFTSALNAIVLRDTSYRNVTLTVNANGYLSLSIAGTTVVSNLLLPGYVGTDKSNWKFKFAARNGGLVDKHSIDNLTIKYLDVSSANSTFTTSQTTKTFYRCVVTCGGNATSVPVAVNMSGPSITTATTPAVINACQSATAQTTTLAYTASANSPTKYSIDWETLPDQGDTAFTFVPGAGSITTISVPAAVLVGSYSGTMKISDAGACFSTQAVTLTVNAATPAAPVLSDVVLACNQISANETWTAIPNSTNYLVDVSLDPLFRSFVPGYHDEPLAPSATPTSTISGLIPGKTYYVQARTVSGCGTSDYSNRVTMSVPIVTTTDGTTFRKEGTMLNDTADGSKKVIFKSDGGTRTIAKITGQLKACSCQVDTGVDVFVGNPEGNNPGYLADLNKDAVLTLENGLDVQGSGTITFENNASLIQTNNTLGLNSGSINYKRVTTPMKNLDFTRWCSPVAGQKIGDLLPFSTKTYSWGTNNWITGSGSTVMDPPGKGFTIRMSSNKVAGTATASEHVEFVGVPNNGPYSLQGNSIAGQYNLIGNPYPSALSAEAFLTANSINTDSVLEGTLYFWTHNTAATSAGYSSADYATYNFTGGVGTGLGTAASSAGNKTEPNGFIAAGEGFFAVTKNAGSIVFNNAMRVGASNTALDNSQFFRGTKSKTTAIEKHRVWLNLTNTGGAFKQMLVGYISGATAGYDSAFDGENFNGNSFVNFYSINGEKTFTIEGRGLPFDTNDQVPLGYSSTIAGTFDISIDHADGSLINQPVYVEDKMTNVIHNLKNGPYSFSTAIGTFNDRFVLRYSDKAIAEPSLGNQAVDGKEKGLVVSVKNRIIKINSFEETIDNVALYDLKGSLLYEKDHVDANEFIIPNFNSSDQLLIVMVQLSTGKWVTKEIVF